MSKHIDKIPASILYRSQCFLGEGPVWHQKTKSCFWVDIENGVLYKYHWIKKMIKHWKFDHKVSLVIPDEHGSLVLAIDRSIQRFDPESEKLEWLADVDNLLSENRCNDGRCDSYGRLWVGTMNMNFKENCGALYCINQQHEVSKKLEDVSISNGLAWSIDNKRLFYIDSPTRLVKSFLFDEETGDISFEKNAIIIPGETGSPDGMTIDEEGMLWIAHWGGHGVYRWNPLNGELIAKVEVPAPHVTSCAFAGDNLDHLIITTARQDLSENDLMRYPASGDVFVAKTKVKGLQQNKCGI